MKLQSMLVCRDPESTAVLRGILDELHIPSDVYSDCAAAEDRLRHWKYDAVVVDCDDLGGGADLLRRVRSTPSNRRTILLAVVSGRTSMSAAFLMGADFVLTKPISAERTKRNLEVARAFMIAERRRYQRHPVQEVSADLDYGLGGRFHAHAIDVSEGGMKVRSERPVHSNWIIQVRLAVPGLDTVDVMAEVTWADQEGNAGIRFIHLPFAFHLRYRKWLDQRHQAGDARSAAKS